MDQESLVTEQIEAGRQFLDAFGQRAPVKIAFWLKAGADAGWYLFVASDRVNSESKEDIYMDVYYAAKDLRDPNFDQFRVKLIRTSDPLAKAALDVYRRHPVPIPAHFQERSFGGMGVEGVYIYPPMIEVP
jgi:hypothetical protein